MALVEIPGWPILYPFGHSLTGALAFSAHVMDASGEKVAWIVRCPKDGTLNRVGFRFNTVTQAPTNGLTVSFQGVGADGNPDGTQDETRAVASGSIVSNTWVETGLITSDGTDTGTKRIVTQGELLAVVVDFTSFAVGDNIQIADKVSSVWAITGGSVYATGFTTAWGTRVFPMLNLALQYSDDVWEAVVGCTPVTTINSHNFVAASNPDERGIKFTCPVTMRTIGFWIADSFTNTNSTAKLHLYDNTGDGVQLAATATDPDIQDQNGGTLKPYYFNETADSVELTAGSIYTVSVEATGTTNYLHYSFVPHSTSYMTATPWGDDATYRTRQNAGAWTDAIDGSYAPIGLLIDAIDVTEASAGGGGKNVFIVRRFD